MNAAIYVIGGEHQRELEQLVQQRAWDVADVFIDDVRRRDRRPGLHAVLAAARENRIDAVVVNSSTAFARTLDELVKSIALLQRHDVQFVSATEPFETMRFADVVEAFEKFQRGVISARTREGLQVRRRRNVPLGRPRRGLDETIVAMRTAGDSLREIAAALGVGYGTVQRALDRVAAANRKGSLHERTQLPVSA